MSSYFDKASGEVRDAALHFEGEDEFLSRLAEIEQGVIHDVTLCTGDREFPDDLRQKILGVIATQRVSPAPLSAGTQENFQPLPETEGRKIARAGRYSPLIAELDAAFHELASQRVEARFGVWSDNPRENLERRDQYDSIEVKVPGDPDDGPLAA